jgi:predicted GNAT family acetyltransferase
LLLESDLAGTAPVHEIRAIESESDWNAYAGLHAIDWRNDMERRKQPEQPEVRDSMIVANRAKQQPVQNWLAYIDGSAVAYFNSWEGTDGVGQVENLFTHPDFRHRGLATALIHHCVADSRRKGAGSVVITADPSDTPKQMYAALGFRPLAVCSHYLKKLTLIA